MKFRKKPVVIEAMEFTGENGREIMLWAHKGLPPQFNSIIGLTLCDSVIEIRTLEGIISGVKGDWIICGVKGEFYPCKPDVFEATYEKVEA